jgi:hypothetical protein
VQQLQRANNKKNEKVNVNHSSTAASAPKAFAWKCYV